MTNLWSNKWRKRWKYFFKELECTKCYKIKCVHKKQYKDKINNIDFKEQLEELKYEKE